MVNRMSLVDSVSAPLSPRHGELAAALLSQLGPGDSVSLLDAGRVIAATLAELPEECALAAIDRMTLVGLDAIIKGERVRLIGEAALTQPAFAGWIKPNIGEQIASHIARVLRPHLVSAATPVVVGLGAIQVGQALGCCVIDLDFPASDAFVSVQFGDWMQKAPHRVIREIGGVTLADIALGLDDGLPPDPPRSQAETVH